MTTNMLGQFFYRRPFIGFDVFLTDGRILKVSHPEAANVEEHGTSISFIDEDGRLEICDTALIISCRTHQSVFDVN